MAAMPRWCGINHFDQVISVHFTDGGKYEDIGKVCTFQIKPTMIADLLKTATLVRYFCFAQCSYGGKQPQRIFNASLPSLLLRARYVPFSGATDGTYGDQRACMAYKVLCADSSKCQSTTVGYILFDMHTTSQKYHQAEPSKNWNYPKFAYSAHSYYDLEDKGVSANYSTKPFEKRHGSTKDTFDAGGANKDTARQVCAVCALRWQ